MIIKHLPGLDVSVRLSGSTSPRSWRPRRRRHTIPEKTILRARIILGNWLSFFVVVYLFSVINTIPEKKIEKCFSTGKTARAFLELLKKLKQA